MEKNWEAAGNRMQVPNVEVAMGGHSSVVRTLAAQASNLGLFPSGFPLLFHIPFSAVYRIIIYYTVLSIQALIVVRLADSICI